VATLQGDLGLASLATLSHDPSQKSKMVRRARPRLASLAQDALATLAPRPWQDEQEEQNTALPALLHLPLDPKQDGKVLVRVRAFV
jgi:hypothetical protein